MKKKNEKIERKRNMNITKRFGLSLPSQTFLENKSSVFVLIWLQYLPATCMFRDSNDLQTLSVFFKDERKIFRILLCSEVANFPLLQIHRALEALQTGNSASQLVLIAKYNWRAQEIAG